MPPKKKNKSTYNKEGIQKKSRDHPVMDRIELNESLARAGASKRVAKRANKKLAAAQKKHGKTKKVNPTSPTGTRYRQALKRAMGK